MSFSFSFNLDEEKLESYVSLNDTAPAQNISTENHQYCTLISNNNGVVLFEDILPREKEKSGIDFVELLVSNDFVFRFVLYQDPQNRVGIDLIPGQYEGGGKVWECSIDLARFLLNQCQFLEDMGVHKENGLNRNGMSSVSSSGLGQGDCLELGCGHALPGCVALQRLGLRVLFADFNSDVIHGITMRNVCENCDDDCLERAQFVSGDWMDLGAALVNANRKFELILTAETVYTPESCAQMSALLSALLAPKGRALVAAKSYYFGLGGGAAEMKRLLSRKHYDLNVESVHEIVDGHSNAREVLVVARRSSSQA